MTEATGTGTVVVDVTGVSGSWTLHGPDGTTAGTGDTTIAEAPAGAYWIEFDAESGYKTPSVDYGDLADGETLTLAGTYTTYAAPSGVLNAGLVALRTLLSECAAFQDWVSAMDATEALGSIHYHVEEGEDAAMRALRPFALIHYGDTWSANKAASGSRHLHLAGGSIELHFERETTGAYAADPANAMNEFTSEISDILADMLDLSGRSGYLAIDEIEYLDGPAWRSDEASRAEGNDFLHIGFELTYGGRR